MSPYTRLFALAAGVALAAPAGAQSTTNDHYVTDFVDALTSPSRWSFSGNIGSNRSEAYLLQNTAGGERAVRSQRSFGWGLGAGFDLDDQLGVRLGWSYANAGMEFRDFNGTGSNALDLQDIGQLKSNIASLDVVHYFVGSRSLVSPYAGAGVAGVWSSLGTEGPALATPGGAQQFHFGIDASLGVQIRIADQVFSRLEWASTGSHNPFNGNRSYRANGGSNFDEPSRIARTEWRLGGTYYLGKEPTTSKPAVATAGH